VINVAGQAIDLFKSISGPSSALRVLKALSRDFFICIERL
jgi:hypothetical protein